MLFINVFNCHKCIYVLFFGFKLDKRIITQPVPHFAIYFEISILRNSNTVTVYYQCCDKVLIYKYIVTAHFQVNKFIQHKMLFLAIYVNIANYMYMSKMEQKNHM